MTAVGTQAPGLGGEPVAAPCEHGNEILGSAGNFLTK